MLAVDLIFVGYLKDAEEKDRVTEFNKLIQGLTYEEYAAIGGIRQSDLQELRRTPAHWKAWKDGLRGYDGKSDAREFGKVFHTAVENPELFLDTYVVEPEFTGFTKEGKESSQSKEARDKKKAWYAEQKPGSILVKRKWQDDLLGMLKACTNHGLVGKLIKNGVRETTLVAEDPETGETIQCRPDFISERGFIVDFKTTRNAAHPFFYNQIYSHRYHEDPFYVLAAAHYTHCVRVSKLREVRHDSMTLIAIEKEAPFAIRLWPLDLGCIDVGERWRQHLMKLYAKCKAEGRWPAYPEQAEVVVPPEWAELPPAME